MRQLTPIERVDIKLMADAISQLNNDDARIIVAEGARLMWLNILELAVAKSEDLKNEAIDVSRGATGRKIAGQYCRR